MVESFKQQMIVVDEGNSCKHEHLIETMRVIPLQGCAAYEVKCTCGSGVDLFVESSEKSIEHMQYARNLFNTVVRKQIKEGEF